MGCPMLPSVATLARLTGDKPSARALRRVLEITHRADLERVLSPDDGTDPYPSAREWYRACFHPLGLTTAKLAIADCIIARSCGVESIPSGHNAASPAIQYCNTGDPYVMTLMYIAGRGYRVGCWGDIVERGKYD